jgi:hypothetical protein
MFQNAECVIIKGSFSFANAAQKYMGRVLIRALTAFFFSQFNNDIYLTAIGLSPGGIGFL